MAEPTVPVITPTDPVEPIVTPPAGETAEQKLARLEETNKKLFERAKGAETQVKELKAKIPAELPKPEKPYGEELTKKVEKLEQIETKRQFGYKHQLSPEETDLLFRFAGDQDPSKTLEDQDFKDVLENRRRRSKVADAIPSSTNRTISVEGKTFADLTPEERRKNWKKITKQE